MKIDRHIGIIAVLQRGKKVTAPYLAEKFEVSRRTINRDIDDICRAGIPIVTERGGSGGISLAEGYSLDTTVFTRVELAAIVAGLRSLDSVSRSADGERLASKITGDETPDGGDISIDLSSFYGDSLPEKIELLRRAIADRRMVAFRYYYTKGDEGKLVEPYKLVFRWSDWYLFGYCPARGDFRLYKLRRLWSLHLCDGIYEARVIPDEKLSFGTNMTDSYMITAVFDPSLKYRLVEDYGPGSFTVCDDGTLLFSRGFTDPDTAVTWLLGFGSRVTVTDPPELIEKIKFTALEIAEKYR